MTRAKDISKIVTDANFSGTLDVTGVLTGTSLDISGDIDVDGTTNLDVVDIDGAVDMASTLNVTGATTTANINSSGTIVASSVGSQGARIERNGTTGGANIDSVLAGGSIHFRTGTTERMQITSAGKVGIGTTSPAQLLSLSSASNPAISIKDTTNNVEGLLYSDDSLFHMGSLSNHPLVFRTNNAERMRIDTNGALLVNTTSAYSARLSIVFNATATGANGRGITMTPTDTNSATFIHFHNVGVSTIGSISGNGSNIAYNTSSDYRLKENVDYSWDATTRLKQLKPARFNWIADETNTLVDGFIAHEVSSVVPEAITGEKDATNEDGSINPQGIDQSKLVPLLVKTIQELEARITTLEGA